MPGHPILHAERFGPACSDAARGAALSTLLGAVRELPRAIQLSVGAFSRDTSVRESIARIALRLGFQRCASSSYSHTLTIDLRPDEEAIFRSFHGTARRHVRGVKRHPVALTDVCNLSLASRLADLTREARSRTGGVPERVDWTRLIRFAAEYPHLCRIVGIQRTDTSGPGALLAFAVGFSHGDHVEYAHAAATRRTDLRMPLGYAPAWELIRWAKSIGADWFDFGGVTFGTHEDRDDPLGGISDFKRYFTRTVEHVGEEWKLDVRPIRAVAARAIMRIADHLRIASRLPSGAVRFLPFQD